MSFSYCRKKKKGSKTWTLLCSTVASACLCVSACARAFQWVCVHIRIATEQKRLSQIKGGSTQIALTVRRFYCQ